MSQTADQTAEGLSNQRSEASGRSVVIHVFGDVNAVSTPERVAHHVPQMIPEAELLLWTPEWRGFVAEAREELQSGRGQEFDNFRALASWLLSAEDD